MLLFTQSKQVAFALSITKLKQNEEEIYKFSWSSNLSYRHSCWYQLPSNHWDGWEAYFWERLQTLLQALSFKCSMPQWNKLVSHSARDFRSYAHLDYGKHGFFKASTILNHIWLISLNIFVDTRFNRCWPYWFLIRHLSKSQCYYY